MSAITERNRPGDWLYSEAPNYYSRDVVTIAGVASAQDLRSGQVLGVITASGKYAPFDEDDVVPGTGTAAAILYVDTQVGVDTDKEALVISRDAQVRKNGLVWPDDISEGDQATAEGELKALGIIVREGDIQSFEGGED